VHQEPAEEVATCSAWNTGRVEAGSAENVSVSTALVHDSFRLPVTARCMGLRYRPKFRKILTIAIAYPYRQVL
jgi:hypothetical protein